MPIYREIYIARDIYAIYLLSVLHWSTSLRTVTVLIVNVTQSTITGERLAMRDCPDQVVLWASLCTVV